MASDHELIQAALAAMRAEGLAETLLAAPYCTNKASLSAGEMGIPTIIFGPSPNPHWHTLWMSTSKSRSC